MNSIEAIIKSLHTRSLPIPPIAKIELIVILCGDVFLNRLENDFDKIEEARNYVLTVLKCTAQYCEDILRKNRLPYSFAKILALGLAEGSVFFRAIKALESADLRVEALGYLQTKFEEISSTAPNYGSTSKESTQFLVAETSSPRKYASHHAYGKNFAFCFGLGIAANNVSPVLNIDAAPAVGNRTYDWKRKIAIQLSMEEIYRLLAAFQGKLEFVRFANHGPDKKHFTLNVQREKGVYFATIGQSNLANMSVQISAATGMAISMLLMSQIIESAPFLARATLNEMLDTMVSLDNSKLSLPTETITV